MSEQGLSASRAQIEANLLAKLADRDFRSDMTALLAPGVDYDADRAAAWVFAELLTLMP